MKKNICITINSLGSGGAEKQCLLLAQALIPFHNVILVVLFPNKKVNTARIQTIRKVGIETIFLKQNLLKKVKTLTQLFRTRKIEIIFSYLPTDTVLSAITGKIAKVPYRFGGMRNSSLTSLKLMVLKFTNNHLLNYTISNNYEGFRKIIDSGFNKNVLVIPNGIKIRPLKKKAHKSFKIKIISLGRLVLQKRYDTAIKAIAHLKTIMSTDTRINYKIVGQGPEEEAILAAIEKYGVQEEIELITNASDMYSLLEESDIYLCTSSFEGLSNALMEAMNCALPIVATDAGDNSQLVINNCNGFLVTVNDYITIAERLNQLIDSPKFCKKMGLRGYNHLIENYGFKTFQKKYLDLISNIDRLEVENGDIYFKKNLN